VVLTAPARTVAPPQVTLDANGATLSHPGPLRGYVLYREVGGVYELEQIYPPNTTALTLTSGSWAVSAADTAGYESMGVVISMP
jgi:hypothetical protein